MSIRNIKKKIKEILELDEVKKYKIDFFNYKGIPFDVFNVNGLKLSNLKQYAQSSDLITFNLGININQIKKTVDAFLHESIIFN